MQTVSPTEPSREASSTARRCAWLALAVALQLWVLAGCGGATDNGMASKAPAEILAASRAAALNATSVHVAGESSQGHLSLDFDLELARDGGRGRISLFGLKLEMIRLGDTIYMRGNRAFHASLGAAAAHLSAASWIRMPAATARGIAQLGVLADLHGEVDRLLGGSGPIAKGTTTTINGQNAVELKDAGKLYSGALFIATVGQPYPLKRVTHGKETSEITFANWNHPVTLTAPASSVALR